MMDRGAELVWVIFMSTFLRIVGLGLRRYEDPALFRQTSRNPVCEEKQSHRRPPWRKITMRKSAQ